MKVKRGFNWLGAARKYRVLINGEEKYDLKSKKEIEIEEPDSEYTIQFRTMMFEKSKTYLVQPNQDLSIRVNVSVGATVFTSIFMFVFIVLFALITASNNPILFIMFLVPLLVVYFGVYYGVFVSNYIKVVATNDLGEEVELEEYKELK